MPIVFYQIGRQFDSLEHTHEFLALRELKIEFFGEMLTRGELCKIGATSGEISLLDNDAEVPKTSAVGRVLFVDSRNNPSKRARETNGGDEVRTMLQKVRKRLFTESWTAIWWVTHLGSRGI
jgi:hypothetical protein